MKRRERPAVLVIHPRDNVAVVLQDLSPKAAVNVRIRGRVCRLGILDRIPANHKVALTRIRRGGSVVKYGEPIGEATASIRPGAHVHIHNVTSRRIRPSKR